MDKDSQLLCEAYKNIKESTDDHYNIGLIKVGANKTKFKDRDGKVWEIGPNGFKVNLKKGYSLYISRESNLVTSIRMEDSAGDQIRTEFLKFRGSEPIYSIQVYTGFDNGFSLVDLSSKKPY